MATPAMTPEDEWRAVLEYADWQYGRADPASRRFLVLLLDILCGDEA